MMQVNVADSSVNLMTLVQLIQSGQEKNVILAKDGKPVAKVEDFAGEPNGGGIKIGTAKGELNYIGDFDECNNEIAEMFGVV